ncbi:MAG: HAD family hydrolase [Pseudomonadota bacterium]|nr:HAD family hydrolase [Pseudomonadota bacterium]
MRAVGILFDKDGTLIDFEATYAPACAEILRQFADGDAELEAQLAAAIGFDPTAMRFARDSVAIAGSAADMADAAAHLLDPALRSGLAGRIDLLFNIHSRDSVLPFDGVGDVLAGLAGDGHVLGIATNDSEQGAHAHAEIAGIHGHFSFFAGYDSGHGAKPGPGMVLAFAEHCRCDPGEIVMVGDSRHDLAAARAAGAVAVAVTTGPAAREDLAPHADHVIGSLGELRNLPPLCR